MRTCYIKNDDNKHFHPGKKSFLHAKDMCRKEKKLSQNPQHHFHVVCFFFPPKKKIRLSQSHQWDKSRKFCEMFIPLNEHVWPSAATQPCRRKTSSFLSAHSTSAQATGTENATDNHNEDLFSKRTLPVLTICITSGLCCR